MPLMTSANKSNKTGTSGATNVSGNNIGGGSSAERKDGSKNTGSYKVNDYTITMVHDNGWRHTELFLMKEQKKNSDFVYKNNLYWLEE